MVAPTVTSDDVTMRTESVVGDTRWLRRLRLLGVAAPVAFIVALQLIRPGLVDARWPEHGDEVIAALTALATIVFGWLMFELIGRSHRLVIEQRESHDRRERDHLLERERLATLLSERERIARELHDSLAQVLGVAHLRLTSVTADPALSPLPQVRRELDDLAGMCHEAYGDVREAILGLRESARADRSLVEGLQAYADAFTRRTGITTEVHAADDVRLDPIVELHMVRVAQEALTNVRKHSGASTAVIRLHQDPEWTFLEVEDNGAGFDPSRVQTGRDGFGLAATRERAELVGGRFTIDSAPGRGTRVAIHRPEVALGALA